MDIWILRDHNQPCEHNDLGTFAYGVVRCNVDGCPGGKKHTFRDRGPGLRAAGYLIQGAVWVEVDDETL